MPRLRPPGIGTSTDSRRAAVREPRAPDREPPVRPPLLDQPRSRKARRPRPGGCAPGPPRRRARARSPGRRARRRRAVVSCTAATSTGQPSTSAWSCIRKPFALAPPSARRIPTGSGSNSRTSATWKAIASNAARTRCARVVARVIPLIRPRASASQVGRAQAGQGRDEGDAGGGINAPRELLALRRIRDQTEAVPEPLDRRAARQDRPLVGVARGGDGLEQPRGRRPPRLAHVREHEAAGAVRGLGLAPGSKQPCPTRNACWSPAMPATGSATPRSRPSATTSEERTSRGSSSRSTPKRASSSSSQSRSSRPSNIVREAFVRSVTWASPPVRRQTSQESTVPNARPSRGTSAWVSSHSSFVAEK